jgi:hypothetical protein
MAAFEFLKLYKLGKAQFSTAAASCSALSEYSAISSIVLVRQLLQSATPPH